MSSYRFVPNTLVPGFIALCSQYGISPDAVSRRAGLLPQLLTDPQAVLTVAQLDALILAMQDERNDPAFALHLGEFIRVDLLQIVGSLVVTAPTPRDALAQFVRFKNLIHPVGDLILREDGLTASLIYRESSDEGVSGRFRYAEMYAAAIVSIARGLLRRDIRVYRVAFTHDASAYRDEVARVFGTEDLAFGAEENIATFERDLLDEPLPGHFPEYHRQIEQLAARRLAELPDGNNASAAVMRFLEEQIGRRVVGMEDAARHLDMTLRTLQRRLKEENTTYAALRDAVRFRYAQKYLKDPGMDIESIAASLGFSETANFYPAFKRWSGMSPGEFRRRHAGPSRGNE
ncbi:MAG: AraC family transcriptional regulator [Pseudomonadota bacterium]